MPLLRRVDFRHLSPVLLPPPEDSRSHGAAIDRQQVAAVGGWVHPLPVSEQASEFGVIGLTVAGQAIALRLAARGCRVSLWDASFAEVERFAQAHVDTRGGLLGFADLEDFFDSLALPPRAAFFLSSDSEAVARAVQLAGGTPLVDGGSATALPAEAALEEIEARLLTASD